MPDARTHDAITVLTGAALAPVGYFALLSQGPSPETAALDTALLVGSHLLSGIMFSPDLDIDSAIDNRWGPLFWIWRPYMWAVPHGSRLLSHGLIIAPLLRLLYFVAVILLLFSLTWVIGQLGLALPDLHLRVIEFLLALVRTRQRETLLFLAGFITGSAAHTIADWLVTEGAIPGSHTYHDRRRRSR
jgi:uncharacterized metal-binding protein